MDWKQVLRFLVPEMQIIDTINQEGFTSKKKKSASVKSTQAHTYTNTTASANTSYAYQEVKKAPQQKQTISPAPDHTQKQESYQKEEQPSGQEDVFASVIQHLELTLNEQVPGQPAAIRQLLTAFHRPFIENSEQLRPKNTIFISGPKHCGKRKLLTQTLIEMANENVIANSQFQVMDLSLYQTPADEMLFLTDLYQALYCDNVAVVFQNNQQCHEQFCHILSSLITTGTYILKQRYVWQDGSLCEVTGTLTTQAIKELSCNKKYFIFLTEDSASAIYEFWGAKFMKCVRDLISFVPYEEGALLNIIQQQLQQLKLTCHEKLGIELVGYRNIATLLLHAYTSETGLRGITDAIQEQLYAPLCEYRLQNYQQTLQEVTLVGENEEIFLQDPSLPTPVSLTSFMLHPQDNIDEIKAELAQIVGLQEVKQYVYELENNRNIQKIRKAAGFENAEMSMHMIFTGNPGTGKTTIARLIARYLKAIHVLSSGQLREVTRADLVGQYVGHTAKITNDVIQSALGGVLFIDEAYALCRNKNDLFGLEAIDALVKGMEDHRNDLVVILAGYEEEMKEFLKMNSGLASRFPNILHFSDYTPSEMVQIAHITAKGKGYEIAHECEKPLYDLFEKSQIKGRNDSGNGRLVRNVIESAILKQGKRILEEQEGNLALLTLSDFAFIQAPKFNLEERLSEIIGMDHVKEFILTQEKVLKANELRKQADLLTDTSQNLNMIFTGNPGTGKTTIARILTDMMKEMGILKKGQLIEVSRSDLVAEYAGQTAQKTTERFQSALGGILFIDEAYTLSSQQDAFGKEAIDTLVKLMEDYQKEVVVILAGYQKEMRDFIDRNPGLTSRFPLHIEFPDYTLEELFLIGKEMIKIRGFQLAEDAIPAFHELVSKAYKTMDVSSGNARMIRNLVEEIIRNQSVRVASESIPKAELSLIISKDIQPEEKKEFYDLESALAKVIGLDEVKEYVRSLNARLRIQEARRDMGLKVDETQSMHMVFMGNPGTGKTMIARIIAEILFHIGIIRTNKLIETDRSGLVAGYVGQTALKTAEIAKQALDGILFIDEAYALCQGGEHDFGQEAIDTLVKFMDDHRDRLIVILAGYEENMEDFLNSNPGLRSRFPNRIKFTDYDVAELMQITANLYEEKGYELEQAAYLKLQTIFTKASAQQNFGNGRYARNLVERSINLQALRLSRDPDLTKEELITITADDLEEI